MREIVLDTETTGLDPYQGHRLVEIGCIELVNRFPSGKVFHHYLNPERDMPAEAFAVHGLSVEFLQGQAVLPRDLRGADRLHRRCAAGRAQRQFRSRLPQCRARALQASAGRPRAAGRHADAGAAPASGRSERARPSVRALRHRQFAAHQARRAARRRAAGRSLCRADRRPAGVADPGRGRPRDRDDRRPARSPRRRGRSRCRRGCPDAELAAHAAFIATLGDKAIWREYDAGRA